MSYTATPHRAVSAHGCLLAPTPRRHIGSVGTFVAVPFWGSGARRPEGEAAGPAGLINKT